MRQLIENVIEDLLLLLDEIDGDADFEGDEAEEDADLEPSIGVNECISQGRWGFGSRDDREDDPAEWGEPDDYEHWGADVMAAPMGRRLPVANMKF